MEHKSVVGFLTFVPHGENGPEHYFELESREFLQLKFSGGVNDASTVPCIDEDDITFEYDIDAEVEGSGTYNLERLF